MLFDLAKQDAASLSNRRRPGRGQVGLALAQALEEFIAFAQSADADVLVLQHGLDDA